MENESEINDAIKTKNLEDLIQYGGYKPFAINSPAPTKNNLVVRNGNDTKYMQLKADLKKREKEYADLLKTYNSIRDKFKKKNKALIELKQSYELIYQSNRQALDSILVALKK